jgi:hypothetical protein
MLTDRRSFLVKGAADICSIIRPSQKKGAAVIAAKALTAMGLFNGQSPEFFAGGAALAEATDAAERQ